MENENLNIEDKLYHFWLDALEVYGSLKDEEVFVDSSIKRLLWYWFKKSEVPKYQYKLTFFTWDDKYFAYYKWLEHQQVPTKDYVVVYSTAFRCLDEKDILFFLAQFKLWRTRRFDVAGDLLLPIATVLDNFKELEQKGATFNGKKWEIETRYIWEKKNTLNRRQLIRIYDKQVDIYNRGKIKNYADYLTQDYVTRVELEVRRELARNVYYEDLFNVPNILSIYKNYLSKHTKMFESFPWSKISLYQKNIINVDSELYQSLFYRNQRKNIFIGHAKSIYNFWFCPVRILIAEWYIQDKTKLILGVDTIRDLEEKEKKVKDGVKEAQYIRNHTDEFHANLYKYGKI